MGEKLTLKGQFNLKVKAGDRVKDPITGFQGIVTCRLEYLNGCTRIAIQPETLHEGKPIEPQFFDEPQLLLVESAVHTGIHETGGFQSAPASRSSDKR